ncbi:retrovirus-related pol polyprotein from transposon TNT 1-94 [Tanacetum coccineum]|uniref:Retrovirus-related pol polyprotein from transposon TNT 1-94 n=1 Tax=Tanacetum coccineum TaxID=301880 RepID=A0ABQ5IJ20_9ASTR
MDQDSAHIVVASKVPMLKPENGNAPLITKIVEGVETIMAPVTAEEKAQRRLELKARSTLLMGIPNEHQLNFDSIKDAKSLLQAIEKSLEVLDKTFERLQKLISQLEIHGESISQEDVNQKFLRSLSPEWNTHTIMWRNKTEIDTLSLDDLYNNLKIYEPEMAMLTMRARRFLKNTGRKLTVNGNETIGFDKSKIDQAEEGLTNFSLMAYSILQVLNSTGLESVEARLLVYKKNKFVYEEDIKGESPEFFEVQNRVLVTKPHNKTPYELLLGRKPALGFMRLFGCPVIILNTIDHLGKFDGKANEGFFAGYSINSKAFRVFNSRTMIVEENLHVQFSKNTPNIAGNGPNYLFDIDALTKSMNYKPVVAENQSNVKARMETVPDKVTFCYLYGLAGQPFSQSLSDSPDVPSWIEAMQKSFYNSSYRSLDFSGFQMKKGIGTKWLLRKKKDEEGIIIKDIFLAYASFKDFVVYQMDVKSAFLYGKIEEEVYVCQPPGFEDPDFPDRVYKVEKALYGLHQAPRAWYETLSTYLLDNGFQRGKIDKTLFIRRDKGDILLVQVYLKGQPKLGLWYPKDLPFNLVAYTDSDYARSSLDRKSTTGEAKYVAASSCCGQVLWIQNQLLDYRNYNEKKLIHMVKIYTDKNVADLLTKAFDNGIGVNAGDSKLMMLGINLLLLGKVNAARHKLTTAVESMDYLPNATIFEELTRMSAKTTAWNEFNSTMASAIVFLATNQKFNFSKYIFESMVKNLDNAGKFLMYPRFVQVFLEKQLEGMQSHKRIYVTPSHTKKIFGNMRRVGKGFSGRDTPLFPTMMVQAQQEHGEGSAMPTDPQHTPTIIQPSTSQPQLKQRSRRPKRKDTKIPQSSGPTDNVADKAVNEEMDDSLERAATTATSLDVEQDKGNIDKTQSKATPTEPSSLGTTHKSSSLGDYKFETESQEVREERRVKNSQAQKIIQEITLVDETQGSKKDNDAQVNTAATTVSTASTIPVSAASITDVEITLAQALAELKSAKPTTATSTRPNAKGLVIHEQEQASTPIISSQQP